MKGCILGLLFGLCALALPAQAVTVDGSVVLSDQTATPALWVYFFAASPSAVNDSALTSDPAGHFSADVAPGVYRVRYVYAGYASYDLPDQALVTPTTLPAVTLMPPLSGFVEGTIGPGQFDVIDTLKVDTLHSLTLLPGTELYFRPGIPLILSGSLFAEGTAGDSILFTRRNAGRWGGLQPPSDFPATTTAGIDSITLVYCRIDDTVTLNTLSHSGVRDLCVKLTHSRFWQSGLSIEDGNVTLRDCEIIRSPENGLKLFSTSADFQNTEIRDCVDFGLEAWHTSLRVENSQFVSNGGGIGCFTGTAMDLENCLVEDNGYPNIADGGGIYSGDSFDLQIVGCVFRGNFAWNVGGAIFHSGGSLFLDYCLFTGNRAQSGSAVYAYGDITMQRCTMVNNPSYTDRAQVVAANPSFAVIHNCVIAGGNGYGIYLGSAPEPSYHVIYCAIYGNAAGPLKDTLSYVPPAFSQLITTNANGDSADTYYNIFLDPQFADTAAGDYHLTAGSPCIDAGDPALPHDPDGTVADIGAYYFDVSAAPATRPVAQSFALYPCYPNPFNATAHLAFDLPRAEWVRLAVYDITGRLVVTLTDGVVNAGRHEVFVDGAALASGIYFARLETAARSATKKLVLIR